MATCIHNSTTPTEPSAATNSLCNYLDFPRPTFSFNKITSPPQHDQDSVWLKIKEEAQLDAAQEPILSNYYFTLILSHTCLETALAHHLSMKLSSTGLPTNVLSEVFLSVFNSDSEIKAAIRDDLKAVLDRDPSCTSLVDCFLNFKGFQACQAHRVAHKLWTQGRTALALLIQSRVSEVFCVDIHPAAKLGNGIMLDHATGVVIGETAVVGNNVSILHGVTLGGTGKGCGDRHPKISDGVLVGAGSCVLGNVKVGEGAKIGAGAVVLKDVDDTSTAVGNPARLIGSKGKPSNKLDKMPSVTMDHTSFLSDWSDYVI